MNFTQSFKLAIKSLLLSKMRALLTMLGIIIGVAAVIIITSLGNGMQNYMNAQFEQLGSNLIQVMVYGRGEGGTRDVSTEDMYALVEKYPQYLSGVTPYVSATAKVRQGTEDFGHDVRPYLGLDRQPDVQPRPHTGPHHHGRLAQQPGQSLLHHEVQGGDHAAQDRPRHILKPAVIQGEQVHQVDADLVCGLAAVRVQGCQKPQLLVPVKQPHRGWSFLHQWPAA